MITLTKNKISRENEGKKIKNVRSLIPYLNERVQLSKDFTLGDLFYHIGRDTEMIEKVFSSQLGHVKLAPFLKEIKKNVELPKKDPIKQLECKWWGELSFGEILVYGDFGGIGKRKKEGCVIGYAIEFSPLCDLKHYRLVLDENMDFQDWGDIKQLDMKVLFKGKKIWTVYEMLSTILSELSWVRRPIERVQ